MTDKDKEVVKELKKRLSEIVKIVDIRIFGSRARGDAGKYSDLDVFLEVEELNTALENAIEEVVWEVGYRNYIFISQVVFTREDIENSPLSESGIVRNIYREGISI